VLAELPNDLIAIPEPTGKSSETRIRNADSARSLIQGAIFEDSNRSIRRANSKGMIDGNPPYNKEQLKNAGLSWMANLNLMEGKALMDSSGIPYYSLFTGAEPYVEAFTDFEPDHPDHNLWCGAIANRFHQMLKRWPQFDWHMQQASYWMRMHGTGPCLWEKDDDWRFRAVESGAVLVPKNAPSCIDHRVSHVIVRVKYGAHELYGFVKDKEAAKEQGWDVKAVMTAIKNAWRGGSHGLSSNWAEEIERALKNDDLTTAFTKCNEIAVSHLYVNEYSGKVSHFIVTENPLLDDEYVISDVKLNDRFLYKHVGRYDKLQQVLAVFFQDIGDGTWHSVRGLADLAYKHLDSLNRLDCRMLDGAFIDSGIVLQPEGAKDVDKIQSIQWGPFTVLPAGLKMQTGRVSGQLEGTMAVSRVIRNGLSNNIGMFNQRSVTREDGRGEAVTAAQIRAQVSKESTMSGGQMALAYLTCDQLYNNMLRVAYNPDTMDEEAMRFQAECEQDGVPRRALDMCRVRANRAAGFGSPQMAMMVLNELQPIVGMLPEDGKKAYLDMFIQASVGAEKVRVLNPPHHIPADDDWIAAQESLMFDSGREPVLAAGQDDVVHVQSHLEDANQKVAPVQQAMENDQGDQQAIVGLMTYLEPMMANTEKHLARMQSDPVRRQLVPQFQAELKQLVSFHGQLRGALIKVQREAQIAAQQQANATALDAETQAKIRATDADIQMAAAKASSKIENDRLKVVNRAKLDQIQTAENIRLERVKAAFKPKTNGNGSE